jgi:hypothetical protein
MLSERRESAITVVMRWPRRTGQPRPAIPARAEEKILGYDMPEYEARRQALRELGPGLEW